MYGDVLALAAAVFCAVYTLIGRQARGYMSTTIYTYIVYVFCALALGLATAFSGLAFTGYGVRSVVVGLLLSVCSTLFGAQYFQLVPEILFPLPLYLPPSCASLWLLLSLRFFCSGKCPRSCR